MRAPERRDKFVTLAGDFKALGAISRAPCGQRRVAPLVQILYN